MTLINYNHYKYLEYDEMKYLYNRNEIKYNDIDLHISKWLKMELKHQKEMICWQTIYKIYKGNSITDNEANNKKEIIMIMTNNVSSCSNSQIVTDNNNNGDYIETISN